MRDNMAAGSDDDSGNEYAPSIQLESNNSDGSDLEEDEQFDKPDGPSAKAVLRTKHSIQAQLDLAVRQ